MGSGFVDKVEGEDVEEEGEGGGEEFSGVDPFEPTNFPKAFLPN